MVSPSKQKWKGETLLLGRLILTAKHWTKVLQTEGKTHLRASQLQYIHEGNRLNNQQLKKKKNLLAKQFSRHYLSFQTNKKLHLFIEAQLIIINFDASVSAKNTKLNL